MAADLPERVVLTATAENADEIRDVLDTLGPLPDGFVWGLEITADAEVVRPPHAEECVAVHPGEVCPGYPHEENQ